MNTLICPKCNKKIDTDSKFCVYCGNELKDKASSCNRDVYSFDNSAVKKISQKNIT